MRIFGGGDLIGGAVGVGEQRPRARKQFLDAQVVVPEHQEAGQLQDAPADLHGASLRPGLRTHVVTLAWFRALLQRLRQSGPEVCAITEGKASNSATNHPRTPGPR